MSFRSNALATGRRFSLLVVAVAFCLGIATAGCSSTRPTLCGCAEHVAAKASFLSWNVRSMFTTPREAHHSRALRIASLSNRELRRLMQTYPAPDLHSISGQWHGINKGIGPALVGLMQDVKVIEGAQPCASGCTHGHNILVKQVAIDQLNCRGWQPHLDPKTCEPKAMGNFIAVAPACGSTSAAKFDYTIADNPWCDPSRFLVDEIVQIDQDILLGRASAQVGVLKIPVAYFVLTRAAADCGCASCRSCGQASGEFGVGVNNIEVFDNEHGRTIVAPVEPMESGSQPSQGRDVVEAPSVSANSAASPSTKDAANGNSKDASVDEQPSASDRQPAATAPVTEPAAPVDPAKSDAAEAPSTAPAVEPPASPAAKPNEDAAAPKREASNKSPAVPSEPRIESAQELKPIEP